jgi:hypothetical protein
MERTEYWWQRTVKDEQKSLALLTDYGANPNSIELNFSGNKSLQRLIHISPAITYEQARDIYYFLAVLHKFEAAQDSFMYTLDKESGISRITKQLADYTYGRKKEIKCQGTPNTKRAPDGQGNVFCAIPLEIFVNEEKIHFAKWVSDLEKVRQQSCWPNVRYLLHKDESLNVDQKRFKPQSFYEQNATNPEVFQKLIEDFHYYFEAMQQIPPFELDLWKGEWIRKKFQ